MPTYTLNSGGKTLTLNAERDLTPAEVESAFGEALGTKKQPSAPRARARNVNKAPAVQKQSPLPNPFVAGMAMTGSNQPYTNPLPEQSAFARAKPIPSLPVTGRNGLPNPFVTAPMTGSPHPSQPGTAEAVYQFGRGTLEPANLTLLLATAGSSKLLESKRAMTALTGIFGEEAIRGAVQQAKAGDIAGAVASLGMGTVLLGQTAKAVKSGVKARSAKRTAAKTWAKDRVAQMEAQVQQIQAPAPAEVPPAPVAPKPTRTRRPKPAPVQEAVPAESAKPSAVVRLYHGASEAFEGAARPGTWWTDARGHAEQFAAKYKHKKGAVIEADVPLNRVMDVSDREVGADITIPELANKLGIAPQDMLSRLSEHDRQVLVSNEPYGGTRLFVAIDHGGIGELARSLGFDAIKASERTNKTGDRVNTYKVLSEQKPAEPAPSAPAKTPVPAATGLPAKGDVLGLKGRPSTWEYVGPEKVGKGKAAQPTGRHVLKSTSTGKPFVVDQAKLDEMVRVNKGEGDALQIGSSAQMGALEGGADSTRGQVEGGRVGPSLEGQAPAGTSKVGKGSGIRGQEVAPAKEVKPLFDERLQAAKQRLREKGARVSAGLDPTMLVDLAEIGAIHVARGVKAGAEWSKAMVDELGDWVKPHLKEIWKAVNAHELAQSAKAEAQTKKPRTLLRPEKYAEDFASRDAAIDEVRKLVETGAADKQRRTGMTDAQIDAAAQSLGITKQDAMRIPRGTAGNAETMRRVTGIYMTLKDNAAKLSAKAAKVPSAENLVAAEQARLEATAVLMRVLGMEAEAGRALRSLQMVRRAYGYSPEQARVVETVVQTVEGTMPKTAPKVRTPKPTAPGFGTENRVFTMERADGARARLREKFARMSAGLDPTIVADVADLMGFYVEGGVRAFPSVANQIKNEFKNINDEYLKAAWEALPAHARSLLKSPKSNAERVAKWAEKNFDTEKSQAIAREIAAIDPSAPDATAQFNKIIRRHAKSTTFQKVVNVANVPRSLITSLDASAAGRQGAILGAAHPSTIRKAMVSQGKAIRSQAGYDAVMRSIEERPTYADMVESDLYLARATHEDLQLSRREEAYMSDLADKLPWVRGSQRGFNAYLNQQRADVFDMMRAQIIKEKGTVTPKELKDISTFINLASGRGNLGEMGNRLSPALNTVFFSPRWAMSRLQLMNPKTYADLSPAARKMAARDMARFIGIGLGVMALAKAGGAEIETDPRSTDWGKMKFGNTRIDIWAGFTPFIRTAVQLATGQKKQQSGNIQSLTSGEFGKPTRADVALRFVRGKTSPVIGSAWDVWDGKDFTGEPVTAKGLAIKSIVPLSITDTVEAIQDDPNKWWVLPLVALGFGAQTYEYKPKSKKSKSAPARTIAL